MDDLDYEELEREQEQKNCASEIVQRLSKSCNNTAFNHKQFAKDLADSLRREHRTLQQGVVKVLAEFISEVSTFQTDMRNESAVEWCKKVREIEAVFPFI